MLTDLNDLVILAEELVEAVAGYKNRRSWSRCGTHRIGRIRSKGPYVGERTLSKRAEIRWKSARIRQEGKTAFTDRRRNYPALARTQRPFAEHPSGATGILRLLISVRNLDDSRRVLAAPAESPDTRILLHLFSPGDDI